MIQHIPILALMIHHTLLRRGNDAVLSNDHGYEWKDAVILHDNDCKTRIDKAHNLTRRHQNNSNNDPLKTARNHSIQSHEGDVLYAWLRPDPFCCVCAGLDGDHWGEVGL